MFPVATPKVNHLEDQLGKVQTVVVDQTEDLMGILGRGQEDQHLHPASQLLTMTTMITTAKSRVFMVMVLIDETGLQIGWCVLGLY